MTLKKLFVFSKDLYQFVVESIGSLSLQLQNETKNKFEWLTVRFKISFCDLMEETFNKNFVNSMKYYGQDEYFIKSNFMDGQDEYLLHG